MKTKVGVLMGGKSSEYEISIMSGNNIANFLDTKKYNIVKIILTKDNKWKRDGKRVSTDKVFKNIDTVFNAMHGEYGEDGKMQSVLEFHNVPYTGSGVFSSAVGIDKLRSRKLLIDLGVIAPKCISFDKDNYNNSTISKIKKLNKKGVVVKPNNRGSSIGMTILKLLNNKNIAMAIKEAFKFDNEIIVEEYLDGREFSCGVLEKFKGENHFALPVIEIIPGDKSDFFDYEAKYFSPETQEITPAKVAQKMAKEIQRISVLAHKTIKAQGYSRSDFIVKNGKIYLLEINTLPGMTKESLLPKEAEAVGIKFPELLDHIIKLAINK